MKVTIPNWLVKIFNKPKNNQAREFIIKPDSTTTELGPSFFEKYGFNIITFSVILFMAIFFISVLSYSTQLISSQQSLAKDISGIISTGNTEQITSSGIYSLLSSNMIWYFLPILVIIPYLMITRRRIF